MFCDNCGKSIRRLCIYLVLRPESRRVIGCVRTRAIPAVDTHAEQFCRRDRLLDRHCSDGICSLDLLLLPCRSGDRDRRYRSQRRAAGKGERRIGIITLILRYGNIRARACPDRA